MDLSEIKFCKKPLRGGFDVSRDPEVVHVLPISGGADSSALALFMHEQFPEIDFVMMTTDTGCEEPEIYDTLDLIESVTGKKIERVKGELDLFGLIEKYNGFLPSSQSRYCTREMKLVPFKKWLAKYEGRKLAMYVGIRSDEPERVAFTLDGVETVMPYVEMGWTREDVFGYLSRTIGVPKFYATRSRSGCTVCPFVRRQEVVGLMQRRPEEFERGMHYEKLSPEDQGRHQPGVPLWKDSGISANWQSMPMPLDDDRPMAIKSNKKRVAPMQSDLFGDNAGMFVAGEFFMDGFPGCESFVWHQRMISYSPTLAGIKRQIDDRYRHLLATAEVYDMTPDDIREKARFAIWYIELPKYVFDVEGPKGKSYTWQKGQSYAQVRHISDWAMRSLNAEHMRRQSQMNIKSELSVQYEWKQSAAEGLASVEQSGIPTGEVVDSMWYRPKEDVREMSEEEELSLLPCPMCHI